MATLFLDRDGVINKCMPCGQYVRSWGEFEFIDGSIHAISNLRMFFTKIIVVTNQQGIGKNVMPHRDLDDIHQKMQKCLKVNGCLVDGIYYCPHLVIDKCACRKPETGMAFQAKEDFPDIEFKTSAIAGDSPSDLEFGRKLGMRTILIGNKRAADSTANFYFDSLFDFSTHLTNYPKALFA
jgi:histidinol-phosphate phosphatase family protein